MRKIFLLLFISLAGIEICKAQKEDTDLVLLQQSATSSIINLTITFDGPATDATISKAVLKYNKDFAYSFTMDDGRVDAYTAGYKLFGGGLIEGNGKNYPGLYYTDGCGKSIPFTAGIAWNSFNGNNVDSHTGNVPGNLLWSQLSELHGAGWDVMNHSFSHQTGDGTDYNFQITENVRYVNEKTGISMTHFVIPSGDINYLEPAFSNGMKVVYDQSSGLSGGLNGFQVNQPVPSNRFALYRVFIDDSKNIEEMTAAVDNVATRSIAGNHYWYNSFTHRVGFQNENGSLNFNTFESLMTHISAKYGKNGTDRVWFAPLQEVYEYLIVRDKVKIVSSVNGNTMNVQLDFTDVPMDLRRYAMTLTVGSNHNISTISVDGNTTNCFKGSGTSKIINLAWNKYPETSGTIDAVSNAISSEDNILGLFPNPTDNTLKIILKEQFENSISLHVYDMKGTLYISDIRSKGIGRELSLNVSELPSGCYYLKVGSVTKGGATFKMFIKQ